ncbi:hypothetical protein [Bacillus sp. EB01]|uniref:hypothetical protein n=1 Tax=Bacillus sp. EB01 TaxID=1347086 RepID=UPI00069353AD|nr:hypothetical protein [Bacillus sp. EB01]
MKVPFKWLIIFSLVLSSLLPFLQPHRASAASPAINLGFHPYDTAVDPSSPVIYMTREGNETIYAVNYSTGEMKSLTLPLPAERLDIKNNKLYVTQLKMSHDTYHNGPYQGAIAVVDTVTFTHVDTIDINQDPFDITVDNEGHLYVAPGSGQSVSLKVYSLETKQELPQESGKATMYAKTNIYYNEQTSKIYSSRTAVTPYDLEAYETVNGVIQKRYDSPYHGDYDITSAGKLSPDGSNFYNYGGYVFNLTASQAEDMKYNFSFGRAYNDFAFSTEEGMTFAARTTTGIDVYQYGTKTYMHALRKDLRVKKLHYQNGELILIHKDESNNFFLEAMAANTQPGNGLPETPGAPDPAGPISDLGFQPYDTAIDPNKPVMYMTRLNSKTIYAANYETGEIKSLALPYPAEKLELYQNKLYVTQHKMAHSSYATELKGAIVEVDTVAFTATKLIDIDTDPYDIAIDKDGYAYVTPGSGQWADLLAISLATGEEIANPTLREVYEKTTAMINPRNSKLYLYGGSIEGLEVNKGIIVNRYFDVYSGKTPLVSITKTSADGQSIYTGGGVVLTSNQFQSGDMALEFLLGRSYNDYEFDVEKTLTFAAQKDTGIDVFKINTNSYLYTIPTLDTVEKLHLENGNLVAVMKDGAGKYKIVTIPDTSKGVFDPPSPEDPITPPDQDPERPELGSIYYYSDYSFANGGYYYDISDGELNIPVDVFFLLGISNLLGINNSKIVLTGPDGVKVDVYSEMDESGDLYIIPLDYLDELANYTLTIKKDGILGKGGLPLENDAVFHFKTASKWETHEGYKYYFDTETGDWATGLKPIQGATYYFNQFGQMGTSWQTIDGKRYYFSPATGKMATGWQSIGGKKYYFNAYGHMLKGWQTISNNKYYFNSYGHMVTGWQTIGGKKYYFDPNSGILTVGWKTISTKRYYFNSSGIMLTGWQTISGKKYYFNSYGHMLTGWQTISTKKYYFNFYGHMVTGWQTISGKKYYFNTYGHMLKGWQTIGGKRYYFNSYGQMVTGWQTISGKKYYFNTYGHMLKGWQTIGGKKYYFNTYGQMLTGWQTIGGKRYYFYSNGVLRK